jgi:integral membrane protein
MLATNFFFTQNNEFGFNCMQKFTAPDISCLRLTGFAEAVCWLLLLLIAVPLKNIWHNPLPVKYAGWAHGLLFIIYVSMLITVGVNHRWPLKKMAMRFIAAFLLFGTMVFDKHLKKG